MRKPGQRVTGLPSRRLRLFSGGGGSLPVDQHFILYLAHSMDSRRIHGHGYSPVTRKCQVALSVHLQSSSRV
jgi:hypothetical protein